MTKSELLALTPKSYPRLVFADDTGQHYAIPAGAYGTEANHIGREGMNEAGEKLALLKNCDSPLTILLDADGIPTFIDTTTIPVTAGNSFVHMTLGHNVTEFGSMSFYNRLTGLESMDTGSGLTKLVNSGGFYGASFSHLHIGPALTETDIGSDTPWMSNLSRITVADTNRFFSSDGDSLYDKSGESLLKVPPFMHDTATFTVRDGVVNIGSGAFYSSAGLTEVILPDGVKSIGDGAFSWSEDLTTFTIPDSVTSIGDKAFYSCGSLVKVHVNLPASVFGEDVFDYCGDGYLYVHADHIDSYDPTVGTLTVSEWTSYPDPMP